MSNRRQQLDAAARPRPDRAAKVRAAPNLNVTTIMIIIIIRIMIIVILMMTIVVMSNN